GKIQEAEGIITKLAKNIPCRKEAEAHEKHLAYQVEDDVSGELGHGCNRDFVPLQRSVAGVLGVHLCHESDNFADIGHPLNLFHRECDPELLFESQSEVEMAEGVPAFDGVRRRIGRDTLRGLVEKFSNDATNVIFYWFCRHE